MISKFLGLLLFFSVLSFIYSLEMGLDEVDTSFKTIHRLLKCLIFVHTVLNQF